MNAIRLVFILLGGLLLSACNDSKPSNSTGSSSSSSSTSSSSSSSNSSSSSSSSSSSAASSSSSSSGMAMVSARYTLKITNLTAGQPLSPPAYVVHGGGYSAFMVGMAASVGIEKIAESGNPADFIADAAAQPSVVRADRGPAGIAPGQEQEINFSLEVPANQLEGLKFSYLSMLGNTNDGFAGIEALGIGQLAVGASLSQDALSYDAGTELNDESAAHVPGPACSGEGFNAARSDNANRVTLHPGILSQQDGSAQSCLHTLQRWDNPVVRVMITRLAP